MTQVMEGMPTTMSGFKDHPLYVFLYISHKNGLHHLSSYVLTRHLRQNETIHPPPPVTPELGKFRGESVYSRSAVVSLKTAENWMRSEGRTITAGAQPMKMVKMRAGTVGRMRELEVLKDELREAGPSMEGDKNGGANEIMQGLYALSQTELYVPDPIIDVRIIHSYIAFYSLIFSLTRVKFQRTTLEILIFMYPPCSHAEASTFLVCFSFLYLFQRPELSLTIQSKALQR